MGLKLHTFHSESDYWRIRNFLREVFMLNGQLEHSWHVARLDYWRWHGIKTCQSTDLFEKVTVSWQTEDGKLAAVLHPISEHEIRLHVHPDFRTTELEYDMIAYAEEHFSYTTREGDQIIYVPVFTDDIDRQETLIKRGFSTQPGWGHHWRRDLNSPLPKTTIPPGYEVRSMGTLEEHAARSWASFRAFHSEEPLGSYDGDFSWYQNLQSAPLYRRDLDVIAATPEGEIAAFCTIFYDDYTRSAVTVLVGTAAEHWRRGLGKAVMIEGLQRLQNLGCTRVFSTAHDEPADALYGSVLQDMKVTDTWFKRFQRGSS